MPRKNKLKHRSRPKGLKRPRSYHHGRNRDTHLALAEQGFRAAERRAA